MKIGEIITGLRNLAQTGSQYRRTVCRLAADTIEAQQKRIQELETTDAVINADRIRAMTNEELAQLLYCSDSLGWCRSLPGCGELLDTDEGIPEVKCIGCLLSWLQQPAKENASEKL